MHIRLATESDFAQIIALDAQTNPHPWTRQQFQAAFVSGHEWLYVAQCNQSILGLIVWQHILDEIELHLIATAPSARRQGIATQLLMNMFQEAAKQGVVRILLEVRQNNESALALYRKLGFATIASRPNYYGDTENALIMEKLC